MALVRVLGVVLGVGIAASCADGTGPRATTWTSLTAGDAHTCGLTSDGAAYCWGNNAIGQLGNGSATQRLTPTAVVGGLTFASVTAGSVHTCGLAPSGTAYCWGFNYNGQLGDGSTISRPSPVAVAGGLTFASLTAGGIHTCGLTRSGAAYCWGDNAYRQLGDSLPLLRTAPVPVAGGLTYASLTAGEFHTCGLTSGGVAHCWGKDTGELGAGPSSGGVCDPAGLPLTACRSTPVAVAGGLTFASLTVGTRGHTCGVTSGGVAYCWGDNTNGMLGDGSVFNRATPVAVLGGFTFASATAGGTRTCGVTTTGAAYCWGRDIRGELGAGWSGFLNDYLRLTPVAVLGGLTFASLSAGAVHTCGVTSGGAMYCWGSNREGQLGDGTTMDRNAPVAVLNP